MNEDDMLLSPKEKKATFTLGAEIGNLAYGAQKRCNVRSAKDIQPALSEIKKTFILFALPYLNRYTQMHNAFELLSSNSRESWMHSPIHSARAKRALTMAFLLGYNDRIPQIITDTNRFLLDVKDFGIRDFQDFTLKANTSNK